MTAAALILTRAADAREGAKAPIVEQCRPQHVADCRRAVAYWRRLAAQAQAAVAWQRQARWHVEAQTIDAVTRDAIHWAAWRYGKGAAGKRALELEMLGIGRCESHLFEWATNGQYLSWAQLSARHRSDPVIARLTWRDPYAVADHVARYLLTHGESEWQCKSTGGLRW